MPKNYTTSEAAAKIGVSRQTLYTWIESGHVVAPKLVEVGQRPIRLWTIADIDRVKQFKGTLKSGPKVKKKK